MYNGYDSTQVGDLLPMDISPRLQLGPPHLFTPSERAVIALLYSRSDRPWKNSSRIGVCHDLPFASSESFSPKKGALLWTPTAAVRDRI